MKMDIEAIQPERILLAGDSHGSMDFARFLNRTAANHGCSAIFYLGDFGYIWTDNFGEGPDKSKIELLARKAFDANIDVFFIDGNHENFDLFKTLGIDTSADSAYTVLPNLHYVPRGMVWNWRGTNFQAMGGAPSIDVMARTKGYSWWKEEDITEEDIDRAISNADGVDIHYLLSHDSPNNPFVEATFPTDHLTRRIDNYVDERLELGDYLDRSRDRLDRLVHTTRPQNVIHGHYHVYYRSQINYGDGTGANVCGLNHGGLQWESYAILDLNTGKVEYPSNERIPWGNL
jgi:Icc-related predicted phosphoesterase